MTAQLRERSLPNSSLYQLPIKVTFSSLSAFNKALPTPTPTECIIAINRYNFIISINHSEFPNDR